MSNIHVAPFNIVGISIRTTNENDQSAKDIPELWNKFFTEKSGDIIVDKTDTNIYCVYTVLLGYKVKGLDSMPKGLKGKSFGGGKYRKYNAKGKLSEGVVYNAWSEIWNSDINRAYTADFEIWGEKAKNPDDAEIDIFVAVK